MVKASLLARRIDFREVFAAAAADNSNAGGAARKAAAYNRNNINDSNHQPQKKSLSSSSSSPASASASSSAQIPLPPRSYSVFPQIELHLSWPELLHQGPGLQNLGNTCFLNSTLQCLAYTPPLAVYLIKRTHGKTCRQTAPCMLCELEKHVLRCFSGPRDSRAICPKTIVGRLKFIAKHLRVGRQEDAHEFLRYFVDSLQNSCLAGYGKLENDVKETTTIHQIFGGSLQSEVKCTVCKHSSLRRDPVLDVSLEIKHATTIEKALSLFTQSELLHGDNKYKCSSCKKLVNAHKRMTILQPPAVLVLHLKRFDFPFSSYGSKITKGIKYPLELNIQPFMYASKGPVNYSLYGVLVHAGHSCNSGHYYSYVKGPNGIWYCMNDTDVRQVSVSVVLSQSAYMLFYVAKTKDRTFKETASGAKPESSATATPGGGGSNRKNHAQGRSALLDLTRLYAEPATPTAAAARTTPAASAAATAADRKRGRDDEDALQPNGTTRGSGHGGGPPPAKKLAAASLVVAREPEVEGKAETEALPAPPVCSTNPWKVQKKGGAEAAAATAANGDASATNGNGGSGVGGNKRKQQQPAANGLANGQQSWKVVKSAAGKAAAKGGTLEFTEESAALTEWDDEDVKTMLRKRNALLDALPQEEDAQAREDDIEYEQGRKRKKRKKQKRQQQQEQKQ